MPAKTTRRRPPAGETPPARLPQLQPKAPPADNAFATWEAGLTPTERRVEQILDLMLAGRWLSGQTDKLLARDWQVSPSYVRSLAAEASRLLKRYVREDPEFREEQRAKLVTLFAAIGHRAMIMGTPNGLRVALQAAEMQGRYLGVEPPKEIRVRSRGDFDGMSDAEVAAIADGKADAELPVH
jgi:hypothetical protein